MSTERGVSRGGALGPMSLINVQIIIIKVPDK